MWLTVGHPPTCHLKADWHADAKPTVKTLPGLSATTARRALASASSSRGRAGEGVFVVVAWLGRRFDMGMIIRIAQTRLSELAQTGQSGRGSHCIFDAVKDAGVQRIPACLSSCTPPPPADCTRTSARPSRRWSGPCFTSTCWKVGEAHRGLVSWKMPVRQCAGGR